MHGRTAEEDFNRVNRSRRLLPGGNNPFLLTSVPYPLWSTSSSQRNGPTNRRGPHQPADDVPNYLWNPIRVDLLQADDPVAARAAEELPSLEVIVPHARYMKSTELLSEILSDVAVPLPTADSREDWSDVLQRRIRQRELLESRVKILGEMAQRANDAFEAKKRRWLADDEAFREKMEQIAGQQALLSSIGYYGGPT